MLDYDAGSNPLNARYYPANVDCYPENTPTKHPYVARICPNQGHVLIWHVEKGVYPSIDEEAVKCKGEEQVIGCPEPWKIEIGQSIVYPYENEVIIGTVKYYGYMKNLGRVVTTNIVKDIWHDLIKMFGDRKIICPAGSYMEWLHLSINQKRVPRNSYKASLMQPLGFKRDGNYWIRNANLLA